jgi:hypothetical protein
MKQNLPTFGHSLFLVHHLSDDSAALVSAFSNQESKTSVKHELVLNVVFCLALLSATDRVSISHINVITPSCL